MKTLPAQLERCADGLRVIELVLPTGVASVRGMGCISAQVLPTAG